MLVDDEPYLLRGLEQTLDWNAYRAEIVAKTSCGAEALAFLAVSTVDI